MLDALLSRFLLPPRAAGYRWETPLFTLMIALMVPLCGYFGAKEKRKDLLWWFVTCNTCRVIMFVWTLIALTAVSGYCTTSSGGGTKCGATGVTYFSFAMSGISAVLAFLGCTYGNQLMESDHITVVFEASGPGAAGGGTFV